MAIPNTTPTPNELYNGEMKKMKDTELRVVLVVTRATLGWELDHETGSRKKEDWISQWQIEQKTGRSGRAISTAIESCVKNGWIEARDQSGNMLDTPQKRSGEKIFYSLGRIFLDRISTPEKSSGAYENFSAEKSSPEKSAPYKINTHTKEKNITKVSGKEINDLIELFGAVNPAYEKFFANKTQRGAMERMVAKVGAEKLQSLIGFLPKTNSQKYAPVITSPLQLEDKMGSLVAFIQKQRPEVNKNNTLIL